MILESLILWCSKWAKRVLMNEVSLEASASSEGFHFSMLESIWEQSFNNKKMSTVIYIYIYKACISKLAQVQNIKSQIKQKKTFFI